MSNDLHVMAIKGGGFANLKLVDVEFANGVNKVGGKNRHGKSNLLKLIQMFKGKAFMPEIPKNVDERKGKFEVTLGDPENNLRYTVKYAFTEKNSYISVEDESGATVGVDVLKSFLSPCLDPWEFYENATATGPSAKERRKRAMDVLKGLMTFTWDRKAFVEALGLSGDAHTQSLSSQTKDDPISFLKELESYFMENRKQWKDAAANTKGAIETLEASIPIEKRKIQEVDINDLFTEHAKLQQDLSRHQVALDRATNLEQNIQRLKSELATAEKALEDMRKENIALDSAEEIAEKMKALKVKMDAVKEDNILAGKVKELAEHEEELDKVEAKIEARTSDLERIREERLTVLESADMPIEGLTVEDGNIIKNGIPFGQDSTEEGITDSFLIGLSRFKKQNTETPKLMTMVIHNASLMDSEAKERLYALAQEHGVQLIVELVMDKKENGVIFVEDGVCKTEEK